jgi:uncharacterized protein DUF397
MHAVWRKSSWSAHNGNCVEVAPLPGSMYGVRDSADKAGPVLVFGGKQWSAFLAQVRRPG